MAGQKILIPYNFTVNDKKALDFVIRTFSKSEDTEITLFNVYIPVPQIETRGSPVMEKMSGNLMYLQQKIREQEEELKAAREKLIQNGFPAAKVKYIFKPQKKDIAQDIIDTISSGGYNLVILNRSPGRIVKFFTGSVFNKVITGLKDVIVLVVT